MTFRVLCLDGGGTWSLIEALTLSRLYPNRGGRAVLAEFDLALGNSGGSIVLAALLADHSPAEIVTMYADPVSRAKLYSHVTGAARLAAAAGAGPRWSAAAKLAGLEDLLGLTGMVQVSRLGGLVPTRVAIPAFAADVNRAVWFRSYAGPSGPATLDASLALAVHASSSAPVVYFDAPALVGGVRLWDGAVGGYNNPVLAGLVEARGLAGEDVALLSLGSAATWLPQGPPRPGLPAALCGQMADLNELGAVRLLARSVIGDPPDAALQHAALLAPGRVVRLNPSVRPEKGEAGWALPAGYGDLGAASAAAAFARLVALDMDATAQDDVDLLVRFGLAWLAGSIPNQATRGDPLTGEALGGHVVAADAISAWHALAGTALV